MKKLEVKNKDEIKEIEIKYNELPMVIKFKSKEGEKEYVLKTNTEKTKLLLNRKEY